MEQQTPSPRSSEWVLSLFLICLIAGVWVVSRITTARNLRRYPEIGAIAPEKTLLIELKGCVQKPGVFALPEGTTLRVAVNRARPKPFADLSSLPLDQVLEEDASWEVAPLQSIHIRVEGAVLCPLSLTLPPGSRICDLKDKVELATGADRSFFRRKRLLRESEVICVPYLSSSRSADRE